MTSSAWRQLAQESSQAKKGYLKPRKLPENEIVKQGPEFFVEPVNYLFFFWGGDACLYMCCVFVELCVLTCLVMVKHRMHLVHKDRGKSILVSQPTFWSVNQHICKHMVMNFHESVFAILN